jgi:hypothetical protein
MTPRNFLPVVLVLALTALPAICLAEDAPATKPDPDDQKAEAIDPQKEKDIRALLEVSGTAKLGMQVLDQMIVQMRRTHPDVPPEFWDAFKKEVGPEDFIELIVPVYAKHFSDDEVKELIKFYKSPIGQKLIREQPMMVRELMVAGQQWGAQLGPRIAKRLKEKGYI